VILSVDMATVLSAGTDLRSATPGRRARSAERCNVACKALEGAVAGGTRDDDDVLGERDDIAVDALNRCGVPARSARLDRERGADRALLD
jgi:hypothetical protein